MKKLLKLVTIIGSLILCNSISSQSVSANGDIRINALGVELEMDVKPFVLKGRTMIPVRAVSEALGAEVDWISNGEHSEVSIEQPYEKEIYIGVGKNSIHSMSIFLYEDGEYQYYTRYRVYLDVLPVIRDGRTFLPARVIAEELGYYVQWDEENKTVIIREDYLEGQTYKEYLTSKYPDPYTWLPYLKEEFEKGILEVGYIDSKHNIKYEKGWINNGQGFYIVYTKEDGKWRPFSNVNVKTGWNHG